MESTDGAVRFLKRLGRADLASLLRFSSYQIVECASEDWPGLQWSAVDVVSPKVYAEAMEGSSPSDRQRILEAIADGDPEVAELRPAPDSIRFSRSDSDALDPEAELFGEVVCQRSIMIDIATGGARINDANDYYRARRGRIALALQARGLEDPNPYDDLWDWYHAWQDLGGYKDRRRHIYSLFRPLIDELADAPARFQDRESQQAGSELIGRSRVLGCGSNRLQQRRTSRASVFFAGRY